ncbi:MAG: hypothetical protein J7M10_07060 [Candidatus Cloacimonetes bacterium]|nr:hypothetical protein [Candidatus Cloacimonadota bacterium]
MHLGFGLYTTGLKYTHWVTRFYKKSLTTSPRQSIFFCPEAPLTYDVLYKICVWNGYTIVSNPDKADILVHWEDTTFPTTFDDERYINARCTDISKHTLTEVSKQIFNYTLEVDPCTFRRNCVKKNNVNASHDGEVIQCPILKLEDGYVYQRIVNNSKQKGIVEDIRIPVMKKEIPFVYIKKRTEVKRFSNENMSVSIKRTSHVLSDDEVQKILLLCDGMNVDYCEIDAIRDYPQGTLYVVDINHCPSGPPNHLPFHQKIWAMKILSHTFDREFGWKL